LPAAAVAATTPASFAQSARSRSEEQLERAADPTAYNPKPDPGAPAQAPHPDIERPNAPAENPGIAPAPNIEQPAPSQVPDPTPPYIQPTAPDIQPVGPSHPEITQPSPAPYPGQPGMAAEAAVAEKSFFDEI
jgi:cell division initiation protein